MTELLVLIALAVLLAGGIAAFRRLRDLSTMVDELGGLLDASKTTNDQHVASLTQRMPAVEAASETAEDMSRSVSRQLTELNRLLVDQAVVLVDVQSGMKKVESLRPGDQPAAAGPAQDGRDR